MNALKHAYRWLDDRLGISSTLMPLLEHPVPGSINWWYVLGSATLVAFIVQVVTGVALAFTYVPAPISAYESLQFITHGAVLGGVVRGIHYWGSSAMVVLIFAHMLRTFLMGSFKFPREMNWLTGVALLGLTLLMAFTGQLLRWDQDAYWSVVVGVAQAARVPFVGETLQQILLAGQTLGGATLTRFYATHVFLMPAAMFALIGAHMYLLVRHGISEPPRAGDPVDPGSYRQRYARIIHEHGVPFWPDAAWRDVAFALVVGTLVLALAIAIGAPELGQPADPTIVRADPRPDWYFLWYFALLALIPTAVEDWVIIGFPVLLGLALIALPFVAPYGERSPRRRPWAVAIAGFAVLSIAVLVQIGQQAPWSPLFDPPPLSAAVTDPLVGEARAGVQLFGAKGCQSCHQIAGSGGSRGPDLTLIGDRLRHDEMVWRILTGGNNMPAYGDTLSPDELNALVAFLETRQRMR